MHRSLRVIIAAGFALAFGGCDCTGEPDPDGGPPIDDRFEPAPDVPTAPPNVLPRASHSTTIDIDRDNLFVAMVDTDDGSLSVFQTSDNERISNTPTGNEPSAVVIHPDGTTAFVANQADATVVRIRNIDGGSPSIDGTVMVGSEPTGLALSPTGAQLFVAEWGESRVSVIDTGTMTVSTSFAVASPYAIAVTNDLDMEDNDERVVIPEFYGRTNAMGEISNEGRTGFVQIRPLTALATEAGVSLAPLQTGFPDAATSDTAFPNQLFGVTINNDRAFVTSISAAPERPNGFSRTVHSVIYAINLTSSQVETDETFNLARLVEDNVADATARNHLSDVVGVDFIGTFGYVVSRGGDAVQRLDYAASPPTFGTMRVPQIDLDVIPATETARCRMPTGIVTTIGIGVPPDPGRRMAYVNCRVTRQLGVLDLSAQALTAVTESSQIPAGDVEENRGMRFFFTGRGRWANTSWSTCGSCHPGGLSDNITWRFGFGPRQSTSLDGSFSHGPGTQVQRAFNWTANFDEVHDFERNTRDTSGGLGAITNGNCGTATETPVVITAAAPVGQPLRELAMGAGSCVPTDWDDVEAFMKTIRPPRGRRGLDAASVTRGRALFESGCAHCHGGDGWTVSERFWMPSMTLNGTLLTTAVTPIPDGPLDDLIRHYDFQITTQPPTFDMVAAMADDPATTPVEGLGAPHIGCAIRDVATFGIRNPDGSLNETPTTPLEQRAGNISTAVATPNRALGGAGYNVPSLYGLQLGAPFLHHGQAETLEELLDPAGPWATHVTIINQTPGYLTTVGERTDLINFLLSIDASTAEVAVPAGLDVCVMP